MEFTVPAFDIDTEHKKGYVVNRRIMLGYYVIMCFKTPFVAYTVNGMEKGEAGNILITSPNFVEYHTNCDESETGFCNSWVHCKGAYVSEIINKYGIPLNVILKTKSTLLLDSFIMSVQTEQRKAQAFYEEVIRNDFERLIIDIARQLYLVQASNKHYYPEMLKIRQQMVAKVSERYSLDELAKTVNLSISRFSHLYKEFFNTSPMDDLMKARLRKAEQMLISTDLRIEEIAAECGFSNIVHFSKVFKNKMGCSPSRFRNSK